MAKLTGCVIEFTKRDREVVELRLAGLSNLEIAERLKIQEIAVRRRIADIELLMEMAEM